MKSPSPNAASLEAQLEPGLTAIVPAYNEAESIADTIVGLQVQSRKIDEIIVVDDYSSDATSEIARSLGVTVMRPRANTGSKAGAQNFALGMVRTRHCMAIDADTVLRSEEHTSELQSPSSIV